MTYQPGYIDYVFQRLRASDIFEIEAAGNTVDEARQMAKMASDTYVVMYRGQPVFVGGVHYVHKHHGLIFGFGTDQTRKIIPAVTRYIKQTWLPWQWHLGLQRLEVRLPIVSRRSIEWLASIGFRHECNLPGYSPIGEPHVQLALTRPDNVSIPTTHAPGGDPHTGTSS